MSCDTGRPGPETCGCCEPAQDTAAHPNPPGLTALRYRVGTHGVFLARMRARIHGWVLPDGERAGARPLAGVGGRGSDEPAVALMDAAAVMADVLTFYQERIANEGFLRTATERRSVLDLARAIGYELAPGVAAETWLAFTVDDADGAPPTASVPAGTQVQSLPAAQGELPQTFETVEELTANAAWNRLVPRRSRAQVLSAAVTPLFLRGTATRLAAGDLLLLRIPGGAEQLIPLRALRVAEDSARELTRVDVADAAAGAAGDLWPALPDAVLVPTSTPMPMSRAAVQSEIFQRTWTESDLQAFLAVHEWNPSQVLAYVADLRADSLGAGGELHALRERLGFFGHNAPRWESLPDPENTRAGACAETDDPYPSNWDNSSRSIWEDSQGEDHTEADCYLERTVKGLSAGGWVVFEAGSGDTLVQQAYSVKGAFETSRADYGMSAKVSALALEVPTGGSKDTRLLNRTSTAHVCSEPLALAPVPVEDDLDPGLTELILDDMVLGLHIGRTVALSGEEPGANGRERHELLVLEEVSHSGGYTRLVFNEPTRYGYVRETVQINANVVRANHGETVSGEVLGSGDGAAAHQVFTLRRAPLTHVGGGGASGAESTLEMFVDGVRWKRAPSLYEMDAASRGYIVRIDDDGKARVRFGDGRRGARLPTGQENLVARYRHGVGSAAEVGAASLSLLKTRPHGIRGVTNPLAASGAEDPERLDDARENAPLQVLTLERIVSLRDYEDFARAYAGIGKARADVVWDGRVERLHVTVADADGDPVVDPLYTRLLDAMQAARDPLRELELGSYQERVFFMQAAVLIDGDRLWEDLRPALEEALLDHFCFEKRAFAQPVTAAEVLAVMHGVSGIRAVDLEALYDTPPDGGSPGGDLFHQVLPAAAARWDEESGIVLPAQLLRIHELGILLGEMSP